MARAHECGRTGPQTELGFFFKDPVAPEGQPAEHRLASQWETLSAWCRELGEAA